MSEQPPNPLLAWYLSTPFDDRTEVARLAGTTLQSLRQASYGYRHNGRVVLTAEFAARLEQAIRTVSGDAAMVPRGHMSATCRQCPYVIWE